MPTRPIPVPSRETAPFWAGLLEGELRLPRCAACRRLHYPPPPRCPDCLDGKLVWTRLSGKARLSSWTTVHIDLCPGITPPFVIGEIELVEQAGLVMVALLAGTTPGELHPGLRLTCAFRREATLQEAAVAYPEFLVDRG
ncbi:zinc ribbon domain-containing protein [Pigmentiphaga sp.]|uniref:Zn-ribbon domain-containing OB-fold protein n=1 Tax=Pigmentiphaga sp. TaxID=1977564 RepID=UPI0025E60180|nr:zinc ribbon domain-containing protein [Pigmentiphaga sp.]